MVAQEESWAGSTAELERLRTECQTLTDSESAGRKEIECLKKSLEDSAAAAKAEMEGMPPTPLEPSCWRPLWGDGDSSFADYRGRTLAQFGALQEENRVIRAALEEYRSAVVPVLDLGFPRAYVRENLPTRLELLKQAPRKIRNVIWGLAVAAGCMALSVVKSHYPRVDLQRVEEGYAATTSDDAIDALRLRPDLLPRRSRRN